MRLPYTPDPPTTTDAETLTIVTAIRARRATPSNPDGRLLSLDRTLLHSPPVALGWNAFLGSIRTQTSSLTPEMRELCVCRVAALNRARYEWVHHVLLLRKALGARGWGEVEVEGFVGVVADVGVGAGALEEVVSGTEGEWKGKAAAVMGYVDAMTRDVVVREDVWGELRKWVVDEREVVEVTSVVAAYNCVSRFLVALEVGGRDGGEEV